MDAESALERRIRNASLREPWDAPDPPPRQPVKLTPIGEKWADERLRVRAAALEAIEAVRRSPVFKVPGVQVWCAWRDAIERQRGRGQDMTPQLRRLARETAARPFADRIAIRQAERRVDAAIEREQARGHERGGGVSERPVAVTAMAAARAAREVAEEVRRREDAPSAAVREWASRREAIEDLRAVGEDVSRDMRQLARETAARPFAERVAIRHAEQRVESAVREHERGPER